MDISTPPVTPIANSSAPGTPQVHNTPISPSLPQNAVAIIPPLYIDNLARQFSLENRDRMKLRGFVEVVAGAQGSLSQADLAARLYTLAAILSEGADRRRQEQENNFAGDFRTIMRELQTRLDDGFALTTNQRANIRGIAQDVVHEAARTVFSTMHVDVFDALKSKAQLLDLENIFGVPLRERKLTTHLKRTCSSVRNGFREDIRDSIDPATFVPLDKITYTLATKYKLGGITGELSDLFTIHAALLRRFGFDHPDLLGIAEPDGDEDSDTPPDQKRKRAPKKVGQVPAGEDFWGRVDSYFKAEVANRGRNFKDPPWKPYIDQIIVDDNSKFFGIKPGQPVLVLEDPAASTFQFGGGLSPAGHSMSLNGSSFTLGTEFGAGSVGSSQWGSAFNSTINLPSS
ncbi:hypothetical protein C8R45DRAFT_1108674 [Mycena sanguinolenta]|nr:hypothetical protein C8R45DRAFT_1108674 [Mycena sanguinolenta]